MGDKIDEMISDPDTLKINIFMGILNILMNSGYIKFINL